MHRPGPPPGTLIVERAPHPGAGALLVRALEADGVPLAPEELHQDVFLTVRDRVDAEVAIR